VVGSDYFVYQVYVDVALGGTFTVSADMKYRVYEVYTQSSPVLAGGSTIQISSGYSAPHLVDLDRNQTIDLLVGTGDGQVIYYQNLSSHSFDLRSGVVVQAGGVGIDVGDNAKPFVVDWNNDNVFDLLVGNRTGEVWLFLGDGQGGFLAGSPLLLDDGSTLLVPGGEAVPWVVDWDQDHKKDLVLGRADGKIMLFLNMGTDSNPVFSSFSLITSEDGAEIDAGDYSAPMVYDIDRDGRLDLGISAGDGTGGLCLMRDSGLRCFFSVFYTILNDDEEVVDVGDNALASFAEINGDDQLDIVVGNASGEIYYYQSSHLLGDIDRSTKVDGGDFALLNLSFGLCEGDTGFNPGADLNQDGCVDSSDRSLLLSNFGKTY